MPETKYALYKKPQINDRKFPENSYCISRTEVIEMTSNTRNPFAKLII